MIFSTLKNFAFIHIPRTAGTTISEWLSPHCVSFLDICRDKLLAHIFSRPRPLSRLPTGLRRAHMTVSDFESRLPKHSFDGLYLFTFVRHPADREASLYRYMVSTPRHFQYRSVFGLSFKSYLEWRLDGRVDLQSRYAGDSSLQLEIFKYEALHDSFAVIASRLSIEPPPASLWLNRTNGKSSYDSPLALDQLWSEVDPSTRDRFINSYRNDYDLFGYLP